MRRNTAQFRTNADRHFSKPGYRTTREIVVTPRHFKPEGRVMAAMFMLGFAAWFLVLWFL
jgi:hypothetical protein